MMTRERRGFFAVTAVIVLAGCGTSTEPVAPTKIRLDADHLQFTALGQTQQLSTILDTDGHPLDGGAILWQSSDPAVASVRDGLVTAVGPGTADVSASAGGSSAVVRIDVEQLPAQLRKLGGDTQSGAINVALPLPLIVEVDDANGHAIVGATVQFSTSGTADFDPATTTTGVDGRAQTTVTLHGTGAFVVEAKTAGATVATFEVSGVASTPPAPPQPTPTPAGAYAIDLRFLNAVTASQAQAFEAAKQRWQRHLIGDLRDYRVDAGNLCGHATKRVAEDIDDLLILVEVVPIDGVGGKLATAGPCVVRTENDLPIVGLMTFDVADLRQLDQDGALRDVVMHEMGHVLGIGTIWKMRSLLAEPSQEGGVDPHFTGAQAIRAFDAAGGNTYRDSKKVPVENVGGAGTTDAHWRESVLGDELMTGYVSYQANALSAITLRSLTDLGYEVNVAGADAFRLGSALRRPGPPPVELQDDLHRGPIQRIGGGGQLSAVTR